MHIMICFKQNCIQAKQMINCILAVHAKICDNPYCMTICLSAEAWQRTGSTAV